MKSCQDGTKVRVLDVSKYSSTKEQLLFIRGMQWEDERYVDCFIDTFSCIFHPLWAMVVISRWEIHFVRLCQVGNIKGGYIRLLETIVKRKIHCNIW